MRTSLTKGLDAFAREFKAQLDANGAPKSEHGIHFCLALGIQHAYEPAMGSIVFERQYGRLRTDIWLKDYDAAIEVKYARKSESTTPGAGRYGLLLADFRKVMEAKHVTQRYVVLVSDSHLVDYLRRPGKALLPTKRHETTTITNSRLTASGLPNITINRGAGKTGWRDLRATLVWSKTVEDWELMAWRVDPVSESAKSSMS